MSNDDDSKQLKEIAFRQQEIAGILIRIAEEIKEIKEALNAASDKIAAACNRSS